MKTAKQTINNTLYRFGLYVSHQPWRVLATALMIALLFMFSIPSLWVDTSNDRNLPENHPNLVNYKAFHDQFGYEESAVLVITANGNFTGEFLKQLIALHDELENSLPHLDEVVSLASMDMISGAGDDLVIDNLRTAFPDSPAAINSFWEKATAYPPYKNTILSEDGKYTTIIIRPMAYSTQLRDGEKQRLSSEEMHEFIQGIRDIMARYNTPAMQITLTGGPVIGDTLLEKLGSETPVFSAISNGVIILVLLLLFRRLSAVVLPLVIINLSLGSVFGLMAFFDIPLTSFSQILPSFILTVGVCDSIHFLTLFFQDYNKTGDKKQAIANTMKNTGIPIFMTSITTAAGMLSFASSELLPVSELGIFTATGVMVTWLFTMLLMPAMLAVIPVKTRTQQDLITSNTTHIVPRLGMLGWNHPGITVTVFGLLLLISCAGISQLGFEHDPVKWLPESHELPVSIALINKELKGSIPIEVIVDTHKPDGVKSHLLLEKLAAAETMALNEKHDGLFIGHTHSITQIVKQIHQSLHGNDTEKFIIPDQDDLLAQELLMFEMSGGKDLQRLTNDDYSIARLTYVGPWDNLVAYSEFLKILEEKTRAIIGNVASVSFTGVLYLVAPIQEMAMHTMINSYLYSTVMITLFMIILLGSFRLGIMSMIPNFTPIILGLGIMGFSGIPLDLYSILIGSIAIGLVVDDTIHFLHHFNSHIDSGATTESAIIKTLAEVGNAMLFTSVLLCCGFLTYGLSTLSNLKIFGLMTSFIIVAALLCDIILLPAVLRIFYRRQATAPAVNDSPAPTNINT